MHDEPGIATSWRGIWRPLPQTPFDPGWGQKFGGGIQIHQRELFCLEMAIDLHWFVTGTAGEQAQTVVLKL